MDRSNTAISIENVSKQDEGVQHPRLQRLLVDGMTCGSCARRVENALRSVAGVVDVKVSLASGSADVTYYDSALDVLRLKEAVSKAGYELNESLESDITENKSIAPAKSVVMWSVAFGVLAAVLLAGFYVAVVGIAQDFNYALDLVTGDWYFVIPIVVGFGVQVGLFVYVRKALHLHKGTRSSAVVTGAGTGTSSISMVACCAHHLADVLPIIGLSGAALFLNDYRGPLMGLGILTNTIGIVLMVRLIRKSCRFGTQC